MRTRLCGDCSMENRAARIDGLSPAAQRQLVQPHDKRYLDPRVLAWISGLDLVAKTVVDGFVAGLHRSPDFGFSQEFAEYRAYYARATICGMWIGTCLRGPSAPI